MKRFPKMFNLKSILLMSFLTLIIGGLPSITLAQTSGTPEAAAANFYRWYLRQLNAGKDPRSQQRKTLLTFLSRDFGRRFYAIPNDRYDADVFLDAQDFDEEWERSVSTSRASVRGKRATFNIILGVFKNGKISKGIGRHILRVQMIRDRGGWKINHINDF